MDAENEKKIASLRRALDLLKTLPAGNPLLDRVYRVRERLEKHFAAARKAGSAQDSARSQGRNVTGRNAFERKNFRTIHLLPTSQSARPFFANHAESLATLKAPANKATMAAHVAAAVAMADLIEQNVPSPPDDDYPIGQAIEMRKAALALAARLTRRDSVKGRMTKATDDIEELVRRGRKDLALAGTLLRGRAAELQQRRHPDADNVTSIYERFKIESTLRNPVGRPSTKRRGTEVFGAEHPPEDFEQP